MCPKLSVCIPTYNSARFLSETIESVLRQSYTDYELIISDNSSDDDSVEIINYYAKKDDRIICIFNEYNMGMVNNWNVCLQRAKGDSVKFLCSDDLLASDKTLERMVSILESDKEISIVATARYQIDSSSKIEKILSKFEGEFVCEGTQIIRNCLLGLKNKIGEPSVVMFRRKYASRGFDNRYKHIVDMEMWFHLLEQGKFAYINEPLCSFRSHDAQQTKINIDNLYNLDDLILLVREYSGKPYIPSYLEKEYIYFIPAFAIWKLYRKGRLSKQDMLDKINSYYSLYRLFTFLPFYKSYRIFDKFKKKVSRINKTNCL